MKRWLTAGGVLLLLVVLAAVGSSSGLGQLASGDPAPGVQVSIPPPSISLPPQQAGPSRLPMDAAPAKPIPAWIWQALLIVIGVVVAVVLIRLAMEVVRRVQRRDLTKAVEAAPATEPVVDDIQIHATLARSLDDIASGADVNDAIVACWRRLEQVASDSFLDRDPSWTAKEYVEFLLRRTDMEPADITALARMYRQAFYSGLPSTEGSRGEAVATLQRLTDSFRTKPASVSS